jgi:hypothetical protein
MDSLITAAAQALAAGDPLGALNRVALRDDPPALALRGIAMAQLGDLVRAKNLLRRAARAFGPREAIARARCIVAEAEIALASRDLGWPARALGAARTTLEEHGDRANAAYARHLEVRRLLLIGRLDEAEHALAALDPAPFPPASRTAHELVVAGIAMRRLRTKAARAALARAERAAGQARIPALTAEVESASRVLNTPAARLIASGEERLLRLEEVEALLASRALIVDACRRVVRDARTVVSLARRPVLFALARTLGEAWPGDVPRDILVARAFGAKNADESFRARLRVEVGRLRAAPRSRGGRAGAARRRRARGGAGLPRRRRVVVELGPGACGWRQPAYRAAGARLAGGRWQGTLVRSRASASLDDPARPGIHDDVVTPRSTAEWLGWTHEPINRPDRPRVWPLPGCRPRARRHV